MKKRNKIALDLFTKKYRKRIIKPKTITHPKFAFRISATAMGPGVGGINACVTANPASKGKA